MACTFCKILSGELSAHFVYSDDLCVSFLDIHPINQGHLLIIPRQHIERFYDLSPEVAGHLFSVANQIYKSLRATDIKCEAANLFLSDGVAAGQEVPHAHLHLAPRFEGDSHRMGFSHANPDMAQQEKLQEAAAKIRAAMKTAVHS